ncbi:MAG TPA: hypothetical protein PKD29_11275 [Rhodocyclaceae bacterium]|nr:hypothetical protein [Rhodocyclaceae bacterium]
MKQEAAQIERRLTGVLQAYPALAIAVSGGVDSLTLATVAQKVMAVPPLVVHAVSPAVPPAATERVRRHADRQGWQLRELGAGEMTDPNYLANPYDRCYYCKTNLYATIRAITDRPIASGTNRDDLSDYRPGLQAAAEHGVVHPFVESGIAKGDIRAIARYHGLDCAELPAQPCLASRVETGIPIRADELRFIDRLESELRGTLGEHATLRVRIRARGVFVEVQETVDPKLAPSVEETARRLCLETDRPFRAILPYRRGSAFVDPA